MKKEILYPVITALVVGAIAFYGGMKYSQMQRGNFRNGQGNFTFQGAGGQRTGGPDGQGGQRIMQGFRPTIGEIISNDGNSITVKMDDGSSKIVLISETTAINKTDPGTKTDLTVGTKVGVFGADNNGTITAQNIQINPQQMRINNGSPSASPKY
jgi:hypothetical protein